MTDVDKLKTALRKKCNSSELKIADLLSSGCTTLNLACTGKRTGTFVKGHYYLYVGDSNSGKTWLCLSALAEAANNPNFEDYDLIYIDVERGVLMDVRKFFGSKLADRITFKYLGTIEEFYYYLDDLREVGNPFVCILDSMDSLTSEADDKKFVENKKRARKDKEIKGSFGDGKAKSNSGNLRRAVSELKKTGSILIVVAQTRDAINSMFETKTRSGGHSMKFYATLEIWTSVRQQIKRKYKDKDRQLGILVKARVKKNRIAGKDRAVEFPIYHSAGIDDVGCCVKYLLDEKHWVKKGGNIRAEEFDASMEEKDLIAYIEENNLEKQLHRIVSEVWNRIEDACKVERKPRYV